MMKVTMIGTGAIYTKYNSACTLVNNNLIVDMPNGTLKQLLKMNLKPENIDTILITHMHGDHTADIPFFLKYVFPFKNQNNEITIVGPKGIKSKVIKLFEAYNFEDEKEIEKSMNIKYIEISQNNIEMYNVNQYKIKPILVSHGKEKPAYGYIINKTLGLTGDSGFCEGVEEIVKNSAITIADTSLIEGDNCHMGIDNIKYLTKKFGKKIITTHLRDTTRKQLNLYKIENALVVEDGYKIEIQESE